MTMRAMTRTTTRLTVAVETYLVDLRQTRASGGGTGEQSSYPALANLLNVAGATLNPKVFCLVEPLALGIAEWHKQLHPISGRQSDESEDDATVIFRDSGFEDDVAKTNLTAILEQHGLGNVRSI